MSYGQKFFVPGILGLIWDPCSRASSQGVLRIAHMSYHQYGPRVPDRQHMMMPMKVRFKDPSCLLPESLDVALKGPIRKNQYVPFIPMAWYVIYQ